MRQEREEFVKITEWNRRSVNNCYRRLTSNTQYIPPYFAKRPAKIPLIYPLPARTFGVNHRTIASAFTSLRHGAIDLESSGLTFRIPMLLQLLKPRLSKK